MHLRLGLAPLTIGVVAVAAAGAVVVLPEQVPPARVWAIETTGADGLPMPVRIAASPGGEDLDDFELTHCSGGGGMGGNVVHFLTVRRGALSRLRDLVREPPLPTLGYRRPPHVVPAAGGDWRELVRRNDDGSDPPVAGGEALAGRWEHIGGDRRSCAIELKADGSLDVEGGDGQGTWTRSGPTIVLAVTFARDGVWPVGPDRARDHAVCTLAADARSYAGKDDGGREVSGHRTAGR